MSAVVYLLGLMKEKKKKKKKITHTDTQLKHTKWQQLRSGELQLITMVPEAESTTRGFPVRERGRAKAQKTSSQAFTASL